MNKRKLNIIALLLAVMAVVSSVAVSAYLVDKARSTNSFTVGINETAIDEDFTPPSDLRAGQVINKSVVIVNKDRVNSAECYVRVKVRFTNEDILPYLTINYNTSDWVYNSAEDCYYYKTSLKEDEQTNPLFSKVTVKSGTAQSVLDEIGAFDIIVESESIQKGDWPTYTQAWAGAITNK